jgi:flagellar basal-body rod protein FlgB
VSDLLQKILFKRTITPLLGKGLDAYSMRHKAIANNLANIEVPGYDRKVVSFEKELKDALKYSTHALCRTHPKHIPIKNSIDHVKPNAATDESNPKMNAINNVDVDLEMAEMAKNQLSFNLLSTVLRMEYQRLRMAVRGN